MRMQVRSIYSSDPHFFRVYLWQVAMGLGVVLSALVKSQPPAVLLAIIARRCRWRSGEAWPSVVTRWGV